MEGLLEFLRTVKTIAFDPFLILFLFDISSEWVSGFCECHLRSENSGSIFDWPNSPIFKILFLLIMPVFFRWRFLIDNPWNIPFWLNLSDIYSILFRACWKTKNSKCVFQHRALGFSPISLKNLVVKSKNFFWKALFVSVLSFSAACN